MKRLVYLLVIFVVVGCKNDDKDIINNSSSKSELEELRLMNNQLKNTNPKDLKLVYQLGVKVKNTALNLYVRFNKEFTNKENEFLLQCAATGSEASKLYKDAAEYFLKAQRKYLSLIHI